MRQLNDIANRILNENRAEVTRALELFELQVGIFSPSQVKRARTYGGMMLLDYLADAHGFRTGNLERAYKRSRALFIKSVCLRQRDPTGYAIRLFFA
jgi:hypothetical protein